MTSDPSERDGPLVSICIASHDYEEYVGEALDGALGQTYERVEVIVVDDGSQDGSRAVLERYAERAVVAYQDCEGQASACNHGYRLSHGDIVIFHDSDDVLQPDAVERIVAAFADPSVAVVLGRLADVDAAGAPLPGRRPPKGSRFRGGDLRPVVLERATYVWPETTGQSFRRTALEEVMPIPEHLNPDFYLAHVAAMWGTVAVIDAPIGRYRVHGRNKAGWPAERGDRWLEENADERRWLHEAIVEQAHRAGVLEGLPRTDASARPGGPPHDFIRAGLEVAVRRVRRQSGATAWAWEGIRGVAGHPFFSTRAQLRHMAWFAAAAIAPPRLARRLVTSRYPLAREAS